MSATPNDEQQSKHPDQATESQYLNETVLRQYNAREISRAEADVLEILATLFGDDHLGGSLCYV